MSKRRLRDANTPGITKPPVLPFYIYGTVRTGEPLHAWVKDLLVQPSEAAICMSTVLWTQLDMAYPYLVKTENGANKTLGELMFLRNDKRLANLVEMEKAVGYTLDVVNLITNDYDNLRALSFVWNGSLAGKRLVGAESWIDREVPKGRDLSPWFSSTGVPGTLPPAWVTD